MKGDTKLENKYAIIIIIITILTAIGIGTVLGVLANPYKQYKDDYIQVDIPADTNLKVVNSSDPRIYNSTNADLTIRILSFNASNSNSAFWYALCRGAVETNYSHYKMKGVNYDGTVYNDSGKYYIFIFDDANRDIISLMSSDLGTVIRMAETFKLLKKPSYIVSSPNLSSTVVAKKNSTKYIDESQNTSNKESGYPNDTSNEGTTSSDSDGSTSTDDAIDEILSDS